MKKIGVVLGLIAVVAIAFSGCSGKADEKKKNFVKVTFLIGSVEKISADNQRIPARVGTTLTENDTIKTYGSNSTVDLLVGEGSKVRLKGDSELAISKILTNQNGESSNMHLAIGKVLVKPKKLKQGESFVISTPTAVAGVRGTKFIISTDENANTQVAVTEGKVVLKKRIPALEKAENKEAIKNSDIISGIDNAVDEGTVIEKDSSAEITKAQVEKENKTIEKMMDVAKEVKEDKADSSTKADLKKEVDVKIKEAFAASQATKAGDLAKIGDVKKVEVKKIEAASAMKEDLQDLKELEKPVDEAKIQKAMEEAKKEEERVIQEQKKAAEAAKVQPKTEPVKEETAAEKAEKLRMETFSNTVIIVGNGSCSNLAGRTVLKTDRFPRVMNGEWNISTFNGMVRYKESCIANMKVEIIKGGQKRVMPLVEN